MGHVLEYQGYYNDSVLQEEYHTTHQCFYSKRSMYLALFRLTDGIKGIEELEEWLRTVQVYIALPCSLKPDCVP